MMLRQRIGYFLDRHAPRLAERIAVRLQIRAWESSLRTMREVQEERRREER